MQSPWPHFENNHSQKAIAGHAPHSKKVSIAVTFGLLLTGVAQSLSGCSVGSRAYYEEDEEHFRYYLTKSDQVLLVSPGGHVVNATSVVKENGYPSLRTNKDRSVVGNEDRQPGLSEHEIPSISETQGPPWSIREDGDVVWNHGPKPKPPDKTSSPQEGNEPLSSPAGEAGVLPMVGTTTWKSEVADWDMTDYEITTEGCKDLFHERLKHTCWNLLWEVPLIVVNIALLPLGLFLILPVY